MRGKAGLFSRFVPFDPSTLPGLTGWWDASDSSTLFDATSGGSAVAADGEVARLEDKSGNGRHFTQSTSSLRPLRKTAVQNGSDVVRFDGSDDWMGSNGWVYSAVQASESSAMFIVAKATTAGTNNVDAWLNEMIFADAGGNHGAFVLRSNDTVGANGYDGFNTGFPTASYVPGNWVVFSSWHTEGDLFAKIGNDAEAFDFLGDRSTTGGSVYLGRNFATARFDGDFGEMITYDVALSEANRNKVISFLMDKWGLT